ncbi:MAG: YicC family protein [Acidobacteria bacterium]|jgi:uncharacterized protein (TIGR00255 family)|nr:YicC family protein [Acidobacteriota bacterium]
MSCVSMTGFGRARGELSERFHVSLVVRGVNHRYLDVQVRINLREELPEVEALVRSVVGERLSRGRVLVQVNLVRTEPARAEVLVDGSGVRQLLEQLSQLQLPEEAAREVQLGDVLTIPGLVSVSGEELLLTEDETATLAGLVESAVAELLTMREQEGERLVSQIRVELARLDTFLRWVEPQTEEIRQHLLDKLRRRIGELLGSDGLADPQRLVQEAALLADRADVAEELVRLRGHVDQLRRRLAEGGVLGRALDFLCQEMHRELNTLGSKFREVGLGEQLVDAKTAVERIREQVQNLE